MKIAVVGAGAMGSLFGALLAEDGNEVWLCDTWQDHVEAVKNRGLAIEKDGRPRTVNIPATRDPARIGPSDLVIIFVKSAQTKSAAETAGHLAGAGGAVLTLQNGIGNADTIAEHVVPERILAGTTAIGATLLGPGRIRHAGAGPTIIGAWKASAEGHELAERTAGILGRAGIATDVVEDVRNVIWNKLLINVGINAITALCDIKNGQLLDLEMTRELSRAAVEEAMQVASAKGIPVREDAVEVVFEVAAATASNRSSMGQDVDNGKQTEIDAINGYIVRESKRLGLDAPVNFTLTALIETRQYHYLFPPTGTPLKIKDNKDAR